MTYKSGHCNVVQVKVNRRIGPPADRAPSRSVLLVHRFYEPDVTTYSQMLSMIASQLKLDGFDVDVFTTQPSYNGIYEGPNLPRTRVEDGVSVFRAQIPGGSNSVGRLIGGFLFGLRLVARTAFRRKKYDIVMVSTVPPVAMGMFGLAAARISGAELVYHCMDLYPEIALASGHAPPGIVAKLARSLDSRTISAAAKTVVLSEDMKQTIADRGSPTDNVHVQNNFTINSNDESLTSHVELPAGLGPSENFRLLFAGNIGRFQGLPELLEGFAINHQRESSDTAELVFLGAGAAKDALREQVERLGLSEVVRFVDHQPLEVAMEAMKQADLAIVSLGPGLIRSAYPSKTVMYLEMGCRVLAVVEPDSELAELVEGEDLGTVAKPGDPIAIADAILTERARQASKDDALRSRSVAASHFAPESVLPKWTTLMHSIGEQA